MNQFFICAYYLDYTIYDYEHYKINICLIFLAFTLDNCATHDFVGGVNGGWFSSQ